MSSPDLQQQEVRWSSCRQTAQKKTVAVPPPGLFILSPNTPNSLHHQHSRSGGSSREGRRQIRLESACVLQHTSAQANQLWSNYGSVRRRCLTELFREEKTKQRLQPLQLIPSEACGIRPLRVPSTWEGFTDSTSSYLLRFKFSLCIFICPQRKLFEREEKCV